jgi:hypothetical protein
MLYVAMTRAATNSAVIYQRITGEADHEHSTPAAGADTHNRGSDRRPRYRQDRPNEDRAVPEESRGGPIN